MALAGVKVGDTVVIQDANRGSSRHPVTSIGRKYLVANGQQFEIATGRWNNTGFGWSRTAYTVEAWDRLHLEKQIREQGQRLVDALCHRAALQGFTDDQLRELHDRLGEMADAMDHAVRAGRPA